MAQGFVSNTSIGLPLTVGNGGTGGTAFTAYSVICAGTSSGGAFQNVSGLGNAGQILTSNGAAALPTWQNISAISQAEVLTRVSIGI